MCGCSLDGGSTVRPRIDRPDLDADLHVARLGVRHALPHSFVRILVMRSSGPRYLLLINRIDLTRGVFESARQCGPAWPARSGLGSCRKRGREVSEFGVG